MVNRLTPGIIFLVCGFFASIFSFVYFGLPSYLWVCVHPVYSFGCSGSGLGLMAFFDVLWITAAVIGAYCIFTREEKGNISISSNKSKYENENNYCTNCGNTLNKTAKFCGGCGTPVS